MRVASRLPLVALAVLALTVVPSLAAQSAMGEVRREVHRSLSRPIKSIPATRAPGRTKRIVPLLQPHAPGLRTGLADTAVQVTAGEPLAATLLKNFEGMGEGFMGMPVNVAPPDPNSAAGLLHVVETVNLEWAVFDKAGTLLYGPAALNSTLFQGTGAPCETRNDGDPIVVYDRAADRWVISQFAVGGPYYQCIAVSTSGDPTGTWWRYVFKISDSDMNDYPKMGVWNNSYNITFNMFWAAMFYNGPLACALEKPAMLAGQGARMICNRISSTYSSLLPADFDGGELAAGAPGVFAALSGSNSLALWRMGVNWGTTITQNLEGPLFVPVASFNRACGGGTCVPQLGTAQKLDTIGDRLMYRLAYRGFPTHESLVVSHSVDANVGGTTTVGVRWYEIRNPFGTPVLHQQGTFAPDATYRWMPSAAMDQAGNIAVAYSVSGAAINPGLRYTGRAAADAPGVMGAEAAIVAGTGSQQADLSRWGDYSSLALDPDGCTFWYTGEYLKSSGTWNWNTRIASFTMAGCDGSEPPPPPPPSPDFTMSLNPTSRSIVRGQSTTYGVTVTPANGFSGTVSLAVLGLPKGATGTFNPATVSASGTSTLTVSTTSKAAVGTFTLDVRGTSGSLVRSTTGTLTVRRR